MSQRPGQRAAEGPAAAPEPAESGPLVTIVRGEPTAAELGALTVVVDGLMRRESQRPVAAGPTGSRWAAKRYRMRPQLRPGPDAWRASALPH
jgi:Acyl-CoA carboxylase epsilon subunit